MVTVISNMIILEYIITIDPWRWLSNPLEAFYFNCFTDSNEIVSLSSSSIKV